MEIKLRNVKEEDDKLAMACARAYMEVEEETKRLYLYWNEYHFRDEKKSFVVKQTKTGNIIVYPTRYTE